MPSRLSALSRSPAALSAAAYGTLVRLVHEHSRIRLGPDKQSMLANRLSRRLRGLGLESYDAYCALLESTSGTEEIGNLVDLISTNHTRFFREPEHFAALTNRMLPELVPRLQAEGSSLRVWSAAASSGEEPYTLAIVVAEYFRGHPSVDWRIDASDISRRMLEHAREGIYDLTRVESASPDLVRRYFQKGVGARAGACRIQPSLRHHVHFHHLNLFQTSYPVPAPQHVIFCRNVMIYFDPPSRAALVQRMTQHLAPGGYLVVGHSESLLGIRHPLESLRHGIYRRS